MATWRIQVRDPRGERHDAFVEADPASTTADLEHQIEALGFHAKPLAVDGRPIGSAATVADLGMVHGATVDVGRVVAPEPMPGAGWYVVVVCGPDAGCHLALADGSVVAVGRSGAGAGGSHHLALDDPLLSAQHCTFSRHGDEIIVADANSTNGTLLEGIELDGPAVLGRGQYVQAGSSVLCVVELTADDLAVLGDPDGPERVLPRQFRRALSELPARMEPPRAKEPSDNSFSSSWWRAGVPIITGVGFAAITGRWIFLLIAAIAPLVAVWEAVRRRNRTRRDKESAQARYEVELAEFRARTIELRRVERQRLRDAAHCGGLATLAAVTRHRSLWERSPGDPDFMSAAIGLASMPSAIALSTPDEVIGDTVWGTPLNTDLLATGSLAIVGQVASARAVARAALLSLAVTHSPNDLRLAVLTRDAHGHDWGFARWLPHSFDADHGCRIATDGTSRAGLLKQIKQLVDTRRELGPTKDGGGVPLPVMVVVIDETDLVESGDLTDLLRDGPAQGVVGITIDSRVAPEGTGATLRLGNAADLAVFQSRHQPRVEGVMVAAVAAGEAERAARRLAALRPSSTTDGRDLGGVVHLVDIGRYAPQRPGNVPTAEDIAARWSAMSPHTAVVVGMASATPMIVDIVRDGPHGLVGGTSGSGKTEYLKTLFVSLCLDNHPDDLSIVIVDFKGGVDHDAVRPLPHVVDVATNLDIDQFKRTVQLLRAESTRRQGLLNQAGASNIDAYRLARAARRDLPAMPRLLVVVDEFGELLASETGREQLKELESITRIGRALGLHLLLVTQNFDGNLPPQIDANAGLRICLRVQKPAHSKAVLDSGIAATIPDSRVGRAFGRFHGRDLVEFQTARVAGRRRDLVTSAAPVSARLVPFAVLASPPPDRRPEDVPIEETDMWLLVREIAAAAASAGWTRSAVPWPSSLPEHVSLLSLARRCAGDGVPLGIADVPDQQRRVPCALTERDEQVVFLGSPIAPVPEVLATYATSLALRHNADDLHLYAVDLMGRSLAQLAELPHCGGVAVRNEALSLRIVRHLHQVAAERRAIIAGSGSSNVWEHAAVTGELPPRIVLLVSGAERLVSSTDATASNLLGPLIGLMGEALGTRIQVVLAGLPKIVFHRLGSNIERRFVLQLADSHEYAGLGVPKSAYKDLSVPRRAVDLGTGRVVQLAELATPGQPDGAVIHRVAAELPRAARTPPQRFVETHWPLPWAQAPFDGMVPPPHFGAPLPVAVDADSGEWLWIDAEDDGPVFSVTGSPKSGRSSALVAIARLGALSGWHVLTVTTSRRSPLALTNDPTIGRRVQPGELGDAIERLPGRVLVLFDDLQRLTDTSCFDAALAHRDRVLIVVAGSPDFLGSRTGSMRSLPVSTAGLLLAPTGSLDGSAIGLRRLPAELTADQRPGKGILAIAGEATEAQVPHVELVTA